MKERRSNIKFGANEALIQECKSIFSKINRHNTGRSVLLKKLSEYAKALRDSIPLIKKRPDHYEKELSKLIAEILIFLKDSFIDEGLIHRFNGMPVSQVIEEGKSHIQQIKPDISALVGELLYEFSGQPQKARLEKITLSRIALLEKIGKCIECEGLLESEINKRNELSFLRYHVQFTLRNEGKRRWKARELFLTKKEVVDIFIPTGKWFAKS